jgi:GNAT superfamily N-acetyltransferase
VAGQLAAVLADAAAGHFPAADGSVTVLPQPSPRDAGVIAFTAHTVVFADVDPGWVGGKLPEGDLSAPLNPPFLTLLCERTGRRCNNIDLLCVAPSLPGPPGIELTAPPARGHGATGTSGAAGVGDAAGTGSVAADGAGGCVQHPRLARARRYRDDVRAWQAAGGMLLLGRGVAGRWEVAVEVDPQWRGRGLGRALAAAARHLIPPGAYLWAQIAPGNAASVRAFLAAGYAPVGAEALLVADPPAS